MRASGAPKEWQAGAHGESQYRRVRHRWCGIGRLDKRALATREQALGANHPDVGQTLNNLAMCRHRSGPLDSITSMALRTHGLALMSRRRISRKGFLGELHNSRQADRERRAFARLAIDLSRPTSFDRTAC